MDNQTATLLKEALSLPEAERVEIVGALLESLEPPRESELQVEEAWREEVAARVAALDAGEVETIPWEAVRDALWARLGERKAG